MWELRDTPRFESQVNDLTSLSLIFLIYEMGMITVVTLWGCFKD